MVMADGWEELAHITLDCIHFRILWIFLQIFLELQYCSKGPPSFQTCIGLVDHLVFEQRSGRPVVGMVHDTVSETRCLDQALSFGSYTLKE